VARASTSDRATDYARGVVAGRLVAGRLVRLACERHLNDQKQAKAKGLRWDVQEAEDAIEFFGTVLCLPEEADADEEPDDDAEPVDGEPFVLAPFQAFIVGSLMGWYTVKNGRTRRRFRIGYIETGKGSGKTPLCAGLLIYLAFTGERGGQYFAAAATKDQAKIAFADCEKMVLASPHLREMASLTVNNIAIPSSGSFIRAISSEKRGLDGKRVSGAVLDEVHEHPNATVCNKMRKGIKGRKNALILEPTNSGFDRTSVCWAHHEYSRRVLEGTLAAEDWFAFVCGLDPCEAHRDAGRLFPDEDCKACDDWKAEGPHWLKSNPNLGVSLPWQYVRDLVRQAKGMPSEVSDLLRFTFCVWTQSHTPAWPMGKWREAKRLTFTDADLVGKRCWGGLDLGQNDDFASWCRLWELDEFFAIKMRFWLPRAALTKYPDRAYAEWERAGILTVTEGDTTDPDLIEEQILEDCRNDGVLEVAYDKRFAQQMALHLQGGGIAMVDTPQGFWLNESIKSVSKLIADVELAHGNNLIMSWMMDNTVLRNGPGKTVRLDKDASKEKIDGPSALVMANSRRIVVPAEVPSVYETRGALRLEDYL
jgi:phage terminase large subunit-like protein